LETVFVLYSGHALVFPLLQLLLRSILPEHLYLTFTIRPWFLVALLVVDQLLCAICLIRTPKGKTAPMATSRIMQSVTYGFLNCKTYYLILLPLIFGLEVPVLAWVLDAVLGLSGKISETCGRIWAVLFYHAHRMGHVKQVYTDAHKFHHFLHDTRPRSESFCTCALAAHDVAQRHQPGLHRLRRAQFRIRGSGGVAHPHV